MYSVYSFSLQEDSCAFSWSKAISNCCSAQNRARLAGRILMMLSINENAGEDLQGLKLQLLVAEG